jgi:signal recognition particle subunit SRP54
VVLTKLDGDARGGAALSVRQVTGQPIMFASNGEQLADFDVFHPDRMASRILGMGDMLTLIEQAEKHFDEAEAEKMAAKLAAGNQFTLEDFLDQLMTIRRMGPIGNLLGLLPGMGQMKEAMSQVDDRDLDRTAAIIRSMTPTERVNPKIINGSRRLRIARGSGVKVNDVNQLVDRFFEARKLMGQLGGGMGLPGARRSAGKNAKGKKGKKGRNTKGRGPTAPKMPAGFPGGLGGLGGPGGSGGLPSGLGDLARGLGELPPGTQLPDLSKLKLPKE